MTHFGRDILIKVETLFRSIIPSPLYVKVDGVSASSQHFQRVTPRIPSSLRHRCVTRRAERARPRRRQGGRIGKAAVPLRRSVCGDARLLERLNEHGEIKAGTMAAAREANKVETWARKIGVTRQVLLNDDLGAFADLDRRMGQAAAETEARILVVLLEAGSGNGPTLSDGKTLFQADHGNKAGTGAAISDATLSAAGWRCAPPERHRGLHDLPQGASLSASRWKPPGTASPASRCGRMASRRQRRDRADKSRWRLKCIRISGFGCHSSILLWVWKTNRVGLFMDGGTTRTAKDLSREELYALVWERPLNRVGPELGLNGPRLAKLCDKRQVPYPPPGYWQKKAIGRAPAPTPLPAEEVVAVKEAAKRTSRTHRPTAVVPRNPPAMSSPKEARTPYPPSIPDTTETEKDDGLDPLDGLHPKIKAWIAEHKREQKVRARENRRRRNDIWSWGKSHLDDLTPRDLYRFRASSTLFRAIEAAGGRIKEAYIHGKLTFIVEGRDIECMVKEKMSRPIKRLEGEAANWTAYPHHNNSGLTSSGFLRAQITTLIPGEQPQWIESPRKPFSHLIPAIVETAVASVPRLIEWERKREEDRRRHQEEERRRWELRRLKEIEHTRWTRFLSAATNWQEKQLLDAFITELEARLASEGDQAIGEKTIAEWLYWAKDRAAELDPFSEVAGLFRDVQRP